MTVVLDLDRSPFFPIYKFMFFSTHSPNASLVKQDFPFPKICSLCFNFAFLSSTPEVELDSSNKVHTVERAGFSVLDVMYDRTSIPLDDVFRLNFI